MTYDLVLSRGRVVTITDSFDADIGVKNGRIRAIAAHKTLRGAETLDCTGLYVLPGIIDSHVHIRYPGCPDREDFESGTAAAAAGGITTVMEMPVSQPSVHTASILRSRVEKATPYAYVDFCFYGAAGRDNTADIEDVARAGAIGFKTFLHGPPAGRESEYQGLCCTDEGSLLQVMKQVARTGLVSAIHAESNAICEQMSRNLKLAGRILPIAHAESRPEIAEIVSVASVLALAEETGVRTQLCHLSTDRAVRMASAAKSRGVPVTVETCPHYLAADVTDLERLGAFARINPPLRSVRTVDALWQCIRHGWVDMVGSDHAPFLLSDKMANPDDIFEAPCGSPGLETMLPVMLNSVATGRTDMCTLVRLMSENPARVFGIYPRKGAILVGSDADFTVVDPKARRTVRREKMYTKSKDCALLYDGKSLTGWPVMTVVRGQVIMREGQITVAPGTGCFVPPIATASWRE